MVVEPVSVLLKAFSGGAVGYITNLLAIKMLFRKYPLIGGGVILITYEELKHNLSLLVERDLINHRTIQNELEKEEFRKNFYELVSYFLYNSLPHNIPDEELRNIPGGTETINNINSFLEANKNLFLKSENPDIILNKLKTSDIAGSEHAEHIADKLYTFVRSFLVQQGQNAEQFIVDDLNEIKIADFIKEETYEKLIGNFLSATEALNYNLRKYDENIDTVIDYLYENLELRNILRQLEEELKKKKIIEIIGIEKKENINREIISNTLNLINSEEGKKIIASVSDNIIDLGVKIDKPIFSFVNPSIQVSLYLFLEENLPQLARTSSDWLRRNKREIEDLIENSINEYYSTQDMWGQLKLTIKEIIGLKIAENFQVVEKGIESLEKYIDKKASLDFTQEVINFLEIKKLGDFISGLKVNGTVVADFFIILLNQYLPNAKLTFMEGILNRNTEEVLQDLKVNYRGYYSDYLRNFLGRTLKQNYLYSDNFKNDFRKLTGGKLNEYFHRELFNGIKKEHVTKARITLTSYFNNSERKLKDFILNDLYAPLAGKSFFSLKNSEILKGLNITSGLLEKGLSKVSDYLHNIHLKSLYETFIMKNRNIAGPVNNFVFNNLISNLEKAMDGRISSAVGKKLETLSPEQLRDKIEDFMGRELKPITILGAILGAISGILLYFSQDQFIPDNSDYLLFILIPLTYALVGISTNWVALKMLFRPYRKVYLGKIGLPFTPGVVASRKAFFARNMGNFVSKHLITEDTIHNTFNDNFKNELIRIISENEYEKPDRVIVNYSDKISEKVSSALPALITDKLKSNKKQITAALTKVITNYDLSGFKIKAETFVNRKENYAFLKKTVRKKITENENRKLKSLIIPFYSEIKTGFAAMLSGKINEILALVQDDKDFNEKVLSGLDGLDYIMEQSLKDFLSEETRQSFSAKASEVLDKLIKDKLEEGIHRYIETHFVKEELSPDKKIKNLFNGELVNFIKKNTVIIINSLMFDLGLEKLKAEKQNISEAIIKGVRAKFQDNILYGLSESILNIDGDIKEIVHLIIDKNLEPFLVEKKSELEKILLGYIDFISEKKLEEIGFSENILNTGNIGKALDNLLNSEKITASTALISRYLIENILKFRIKNILQMLGINSLKEAFVMFESEINSLRRYLAGFISLKKDSIITEASELIIKILEDEVLSVEIGTLLEGISDTELDENTDKIIEKILSTVTWQKFSTSFITDFLKKENLFSIINTEMLKKDIEKLFDKIITDPESELMFKHIVRDFTAAFLPEANKIADKQIKDFLLKTFADTLLQSLENHGINLFNSINISEVVEKEINNMHPQEIEELFNSFAKPYFRKLILYGWLGGIIGLADAAIAALQ